MAIWPTHCAIPATAFNYKFTRMLFRLNNFLLPLVTSHRYVDYGRSGTFDLLSNKSQFKRHLIGTFRVRFTLCVRLLADGQ